MLKVRLKQVNSQRYHGVLSSLIDSKNSLGILLRTEREQGVHLQKPRRCSHQSTTRNNEIVSLKRERQSSADYSLLPTEC